MQYEFFQDSLTYQYLRPFYGWILLHCLDYIVMPAVRIPQQEKIRPPWQCNRQRKGNLLLTQARAPAATNEVVQSQRAPSPSFHAQYTIFDSPVHHLKDIWVVCIFWLLWIVVLWTQYKFSNGCILSGVYYGMELLSHVGTLFNLLRNYQAVFHSSCTTLHPHQQSKDSNFSISLPTLVILSFLFFFLFFFYFYHFIVTNPSPSTLVHTCSIM